MNAHLGTALARTAACAIGITVAATLSFAGASSASAEAEERTLSLTRSDGSPIGTLFSDWTMVPGDSATTTVIAHRTGGGESNLSITLGDNATGSEATATTVQNDVLITVESNGAEYSASAAALMRGDAVIELGRSAAASVPIDVTFELPFSSGNGTQRQSIDLSLVVTAVDTVAPGAPVAPAANVDTNASGDAVTLPDLASTGASIREALIAAAMATCVGLLLIGLRRRRRRDETVEPD